jgi:hypothetical protein
MRHLAANLAVVFATGLFFVAAPSARAEPNVFTTGWTAYDECAGETVHAVERVVWNRLVNYPDVRDVVSVHIEGEGLDSGARYEGVNHETESDEYVILPDDGGEDLFLRRLVFVMLITKAGEGPIARTRIVVTYNPATDTSTARILEPFTCV